MGYYEEIKETRKLLKKEMLKAGIKNVSITGEKGTAYDWTEINPVKKDRGGYYNWEEQDLKKLSEFGIRNPSGTVARTHEIKAMIYGHQAKKFKQSKKYQALKQEFDKIALQQADSGTCVGGAGTIIKRQGKPIDVWRQHGQSESRDIVAQNILRDRARKLGLEFEHEGGWMD